MTGLQLTTLNNGLRIITDTVPGMHSVGIGFWVGVGTRDEDPAFNGVAHMVEHMLFKGTHKRTARDIVEEIESAGGQMNAYTSREVTSYHAHILKDDLPLALDVLADMIQNSTLPDEEIERERHVILQEIGMCADTPDDLVFDYFYETAWPGQTLGSPILGTTDIIASMQKKPLQDHIENLYTPNRIVVSAAGGVDHNTLVKQIEDLLTTLPANNDLTPDPARYSGGERRENKDLEQSHIVLGFQGIGRNSDDYFSGRILSTILGGGMSSRLFQEVREKRGLAYAVYSFASAYSDAGLFGIYAGTGPDKLGELIPVLCDQATTFAGTVSESEVERAKTQLKAGLLMGRESMMTRADQHAKHLLFRNEVFDADKIISQIEAVDQNAVRKTAHKIFTSPHTLSALGPLDNLENSDSIARRLVA